MEIAKVVVEWVLNNIFSPALAWLLNRENWPWPALPAFLLLLCMSAVTVAIVWPGQPSGCPLKSEPRNFLSKLEFQDCDCCPMMVVLPRGDYEMGKRTEEPENFEDCNIPPPKKVVIKKSFAISKNEITIKNFRDFKAHQHSPLGKVWAALLSSVNIDVNSKELGCYVFRPIGDAGEGIHVKDEKLSWQDPGFIQNSDKHPVVCVDWNQASEYASWLTRITKQTYELPSAEEWEYAAGGAKDEIQYWDKDKVCQYANLHDKTSKEINKYYWEHAPCEDKYPIKVERGERGELEGLMQTAPVGTFQSNKFDLKDMLGNVNEWVRDQWSLLHPEHYMMRGGSWKAAPDRVRPIGCYTQPKTFRGDDIGFRVTRKIN